MSLLRRGAYCPVSIAARVGAQLGCAYANGKLTPSLAKRDTFGV